MEIKITTKYIRQKGAEGNIYNHVPSHSLSHWEYTWPINNDITLLSQIKTSHTYMDIITYPRTCIPHGRHYNAIVGISLVLTTAAACVQISCFYFGQNRFLMKRELCHLRPTLSLFGHVTLLFGMVLPSLVPLVSCSTAAVKRKLPWPGRSATK